jgi:Tfp pilus tip-associated adhesin PilY1
MDGSPKIADIRLADGTWHTYMFIGQGAGGTFYQAIDVTLAGMGDNAFPNGLLQTDDDNGDLLTFFSNPNVMPVRWSFPSLTDWDPTITNNANATDANNPYLMHYGDIKKTAATISKTVGQTWSDPAVGQVVNTTSPYVVLAGSGFLPYSAQQQSNRGGTIAGTTFYILKAEDGTLLDTRDAGNDGTVETLDNCVAINDCTKFKNALQSDPVATGPSDSRFITKAYIADLDGRIWRFDITLDPTNKPIFVTTGTNPVKMYEDALKQPFFSSMATVNVGGTQQFIFAATGADLLPANGVSTQYRLLGVLDNGATGSKTFEIDLTKVDGTAGDEKVTAFPAVAGDIVFFTTTTFNPATPCTLPTASLYALTFIGGPAYDTNNDGTFDKKDSTLVKSIAGVRATAPFIVDQHLVFGAGNRVQVFGDKDDYNNGIGQAGVRILSWREVR